VAPKDPLNVMRTSEMAGQRHARPTRTVTKVLSLVNKLCVPDHHW
jgi:hypothetical protein